MPTERKPSAAKLELARVREQELRKAERKTRLAERVAAGASGGPVEVEPPPDRRAAPDAPFLDEL